LTAQHYDAVTQAWRIVMGEAFHYGIFEGPEAEAPVEALDRATVRLNEWMLAGAGDLAKGARVLDVGCGIGGPARWLARQAGVQVRGLSNSAEGVATAQALTDDPEVDFVVGDALDNQQPDAHFDLVWVMESSHLMPDKPQLLRECARVMKPGARLVLCDLVIKRPFTLEEVFEHRRDLRCLDRAFGRAKMETLAQYAEWAEAAGLQVDGTVDWTVPTRPTLLAWGENATRHEAELVELIGAKGVKDLRRSCAVLLDFWDTERMGYGLLRAHKPA
jgi:27-O-demethylrifamycin SV methyltransferase